RSVSCAVGAQPGGARCTGVAAASFQAGADANSDQESVAAHCSELRVPEEAQVVEPGGAEVPPGIATADLDQAATRRLAADAGTAGCHHRGVERSGGDRSRKGCSRATTEDPSWSWTDHRIGVRADHGTGGEVCKQPTGGQLLGVDSYRRLQLRSTPLGS